MTPTPEENAVLAEFGCDLSEEEISPFMIAMAAHILVQRKSKISSYARHLEIERDSLHAEIVKLRAEVLKIAGQRDNESGVLFLVAEERDSLRTQLESVTKERGTFKYLKEQYFESSVVFSEQRNQSRALAAKYRGALKEVSQHRDDYGYGSLASTRAAKIAQKALVSDPAGESDLSVIRGAIEALEGKHEGCNYLASSPFCNKCNFFIPVKLLAALKERFGDGK